MPDSRIPVTSILSLMQKKAPSAIKLLGPTSSSVPQIYNPRQNELLGGRPFAVPAPDHYQPRELEIVQPEDPHFWEVAVVGPPNAGKSSIVNQIVGEKVSIVSQKAQTTQDRIMGVLTQGNSQVCFADTPGIVMKSEAKKLNKQIVTTSWNTVATSQLALVVFDIVKHSNIADSLLLAKLNEHRIPTWLILNKIDLVRQKSKNEYIANKIRYFDGLYSFDRAFLVSAAKDEGIEELKNALLDHAPPGFWQYNSQIKTSMSDIDMVSETIREQLFRRLNQEIPYQIEQETISWVDEPELSRIDQAIIAPSKRVIPIIVGKNGDTLRAIGKTAKERLEKYFDRKILLNLTVRTKDR